MTSTTMTVQVVYASEQAQTLKILQLPAGSLVRHAIEDSGLLKQYPEINLSRNKVAVYGQRCALDRVLEAGDRVEILRPLKLTPMEARRLRAARAKQSAK